MKTLLFFFLLLFVAFPVSSQSANQGLGFYVNQAHVGLNVGADWRYSFSEKYTGYIGLKYMGNRIIKDNQNYAYKSRFYATAAAEHIGARIGIQRNLKLPKSGIRPFVFYQLQFTRSHLRTTALQIDTFTINQPNPQLVVQVTEINTVSREQITSLESTIGIGFQVQLFGPIDLRLSGGLSVPLLWQTINVGGVQHDFSGFYEAGLVWRLPAKKRE